MASQRRFTAKTALADLESMDINSPEFISRLRLLQHNVNEHAAWEETGVASASRSKLSGEQLQRLRRAMEIAEAIAPTRPHPPIGSARGECVHPGHSRPWWITRGTRSTLRVRTPPGTDARSAPDGAPKSAQRLESVNPLGESQAARRPRRKLDDATGDKPPGSPPVSHVVRSHPLRHKGALRS